MNERVVEILVFIMSEIKNDHGTGRRLDALSKDLIQKGYTENEISSAFSWLLERMKYETEELIESEGPMRGSFRHLHEIERSILSTEAFGYIIQLKELGIIDEMQVEHILERAMILGSSQVGKQEIKSIVASVILTSESIRDGSFFLFDEFPVIQ